MIDWITAYIPFPHNEPINNGQFINLDSDGVIERTTDKFLPIEGSYSSKVSIRSHADDKVCRYIFKTKYSHLILSGNPVKFLQGHNIFGSDDLPSLLADCFRKVCDMIGKPEIFNYTAVHEAHLTRVDINYGYLLDNPETVNAWLRSAESSAHLKHRGKGQFDHGTLYFGRGSSYWMVKFYHKGGEIKANKKHQRIDLLDNKSVALFADKLLRCEIQLRTRELSRAGLYCVSAWHDVDVAEVYNSYTSRLEFSNNTMTVIDDKIKDLPPHYRRSYKAWTHGEDLRQDLSRPTFYKHRRYLLDNIGIDIGIKQSSDKPDMTNVVPLVRYLEAVPAQTPSWASGTDWLYEPNHFPEESKRSLEQSDFPQLASFK